MCLMTHVECKISFIGLDDEVRKVGRVMKQKQRELAHSITSYVILNPHVSLLASHIYYPFQYQMCILGQPNALIFILNQVMLQWLQN